MKLDRNITNPRRGKYALIKLREHTVRRIDHLPEDENVRRQYVAVHESAVDYGDSDDTDFFVIRLKDKYASAALKAYARAASKDDREYADEVYQLSVIAEKHPNKRNPD